MPPLVLSLAELRARIGAEIGVTGWFLVTQERIRQFADATGDSQWIHLDTERAAKESPYGATVAHGFLTLSLLSGFMKEALAVEGLAMTVNYGLNRVRFPAPVKAGSRIRARFTLQSMKDSEAVFLATMEAEDAAKPCCVAEWVVRYYEKS